MSPQRSPLAAGYAAFNGRPPQRMPFLAANAGAFLAFGGQDVAVAGVGVAPAQAGVWSPGLHGVAGTGVVGGDLGEEPPVRVRGKGHGQTGGGQRLREFDALGFLLGGRRRSSPSGHPPRSASPRGSGCAIRPARRGRGRESGPRGRPRPARGRRHTAAERGTRRTPERLAVVGGVHRAEDEPEPGNPQHARTQARSGRPAAGAGLWRGRRGDLDRVRDVVTTPGALGRVGW